MPARREVRDVMSRRVVTVTPEATIAEVAEIMLANQVGSVVVVDAGDPGTVVGIVTETDYDVSDEPIPFAFFRWPRLFEEWVWSEESLEELYRRRRERPIATLMTSPVTTTDVGAEVFEAVGAMLRAGVHHVPVLEEGRLAGMLTRHDLLKLLALEPLGGPPAVAAAGQPAEAPPVFERIVAGVDGSDDSLLALGQGLALRASGGRLVAVTARYLPGAIHAGAYAPAAAEELDAEAEAARQAAADAIGGASGAETRLVDGRPLDALFAVAKEERATLIAIGTPPGGRVEGMVFGHVASTILHDAPCPVLVGRRAWGGDVPRTVVCGYDGSLEAGRALAVAHALGARFGATVRVIAGKGGKTLDDDQLAAVPGLEIDDRAPADALVAASAEADLLVVGSRGLHGVRALGSVSEKVAHRAASSVLVVRPSAEAT